MKSEATKIRIYFLILITLWLMTINLFPQFGGGDGTVEDPWQIETAEHLDNIRNFIGVVNANKHFILVADIDLGVAPWNEGEGWVPVGGIGVQRFQGHLNGNGHIIRNLTINRSADYQGLFASLKGTGSIKDIGLVDVDIAGGNPVGGIVAYIEDSGVIERCFVTGKIDGLVYVGGIVGIKGSRINQNSCVQDCYSNVHITVRAGASALVYAGGIIGSHFSGSTSCCYVTGFIEATKVGAGAVIGRIANGNVSDVYWNKDIAWQMEGFTPFGSLTEQLLQTNTYSGFDFDTVWNVDEGRSYAYLRWQGEEPHDHNLPLMPPFNIDLAVGNGFVDLTWQSPPEEIAVPNGYNVYRNRERINQQPIEELRYRDEEVENRVKYTYYVTAIYSEKESAPSKNAIATPINVGGGNGTAENPFQIANATHLNEMRYALDKHFLQTANINLGKAPWNEEQGWSPISHINNKFTGSYNGNGYLIEGLTINSERHSQSLFGYGDRVDIINVCLEDVNISGAGNIGALFSHIHYSNIKNCYVKGSIKGRFDVGGITATTNGGTITGCYATGEVIAQEGRVGGLVGVLGDNSNLINSYSTAMVQGSRTGIGGIVGEKSGYINNCYSTGAVIAFNKPDYVGGLVGKNSNGTVNNSFWNIETNGRYSSPAGGVGTNMAQMLSREMYEGAGWTFPDVWNILEDETYPFLAWEDGPSFHNRPGPFRLRGESSFEDREIRLEWDMIDSPSYYNVFRDNVMIGSVNHPLKELVDTDDVEPYVEYTYYVRAVYVEDEEEIVSSPSNPLVFALTTFIGNGTTDNPYQVANEEQLNVVRHLLDAHYVQTADINLNGIFWESIGGVVSFKGVYDGNGFKIANLNTFNHGSFKGLFGTVLGAAIRNVILEDVDLVLGNYGGSLVGEAEMTDISNVTVTGRIEATGHSVGGLIGCASSSPNIIRNCSVSGTMTVSGDFVGGLIGSGDGIVNDCWTDVTITIRGGYAGGLIGSSYYSTLRINRCAVFGDITSTVIRDELYLGGIIGYAYDTYIEDSYVTGNVVGRGDYVGGLVGVKEQNCYSVLRCYTTGVVNGRNYVGGLIGAIKNINTGVDTNIEDCYAIGTVTGAEYVGGLIGCNNDKTVLHCYSTGDVRGNSNVGGLIGAGNGATINSYWDIQKSGQTDSPGGGLPRDSSHMRYPYAGNTYVDWDFTDVWTHDITPSWNRKYPRLYYQEKPVGFIDVPELKVEIVQIDGTDHFRIRWELVEGALSYKIYVSDTLNNNDWGEPISVVGEDVTIYTEPIGEHKNRFFYVVASPRAAR